MLLNKQAVDSVTNIEGKTGPIFKEKISEDDRNIVDESVVLIDQVQQRLLLAENSRARDVLQRVTDSPCGLPAAACHRRQVDERVRCQEVALSCNIVVAQEGTQSNLILRCCKVSHEICEGSLTVLKHVRGSDIGSTDDFVEKLSAEMSSTCDRCFFRVDSTDFRVLELGVLLLVVGRLQALQAFVMLSVLDLRLLDQIRLKKSCCFC